MKNIISEKIEKKLAFLLIIFGNDVKVCDFFDLEKVKEVLERDLSKKTLDISFFHPSEKDYNLEYVMNHVSRCLKRDSLEDHIWFNYYDKREVKSHTDKQFCLLNKKFLPLFFSIVNGKVRVKRSSLIASKNLSTYKIQKENIVGLFDLIKTTMFLEIGDRGIIFEWANACLEDNNSLEYIFHTDNFLKLFFIGDYIWPTFYVGNHKYFNNKGEIILI